jgi:hypothetical protein
MQDIVDSTSAAVKEHSPSAATTAAFLARTNKMIRMQKIRLVSAALFRTDGASITRAGAVVPGSFTSLTVVKLTYTVFCITEKVFCNTEHSTAEFHPYSRATRACANRPPTRPTSLENRIGER